MNKPLNSQDIETLEELKDFQNSLGRKLTIRIVILFTIIFAVVIYFDNAAAFWGAIVATFVSLFTIYRISYLPSRKINTDLSIGIKKEEAIDIQKIHTSKDGLNFTLEGGLTVYGYELEEKKIDIQNLILGHSLRVQYTPFSKIILTVNNEDNAQQHL